MSKKKIILLLVLSILFFLKVNYSWFILPRTPAVGQNLTDFRNSFLLLGLNNLGVIYLSLTPLTLVVLAAKRFQSLLILLSLIVLVGIGFFVFAQSTPNKARAMMKLPLTSDARDIKYNYLEIGFGYKSIYIEFKSNETAASRQMFYDDYFSNHGFQKNTEYGGKEITYGCQRDVIRLSIDGGKTTLSPYEWFGESCLDKL